ncbi:MFS transporter [Cohnella sp. AR92]|nr:MFS transporter [Cohnella sp. AR92]
MTIGLGELAIGAVLEPMIHAYGVQYSDGGQLVMNQFLGGLVGTLIAPFLIKRLGRKSVLLAAFLLMAIMEFIFMAEPAWSVMLIVAPLTGLGFGIIEAMIGALIITSTGDKANVAMSRLETCFGLGALIIPFAGAALIEAGQWKLAFGLVGLLAAATLVLWAAFWPTELLGDRGSAKDRMVEESAGTARGSAKPAFRLAGRFRILLAVCALYFFVYVGLEMSFVHYLPSMLVQENGISDATAAMSISAFWVAMTIGRIVAGHIADRISGAMYLFYGCSIGAACFLFMALTGGVSAMFVFTFIAGLAMSGLFAIALVFTNRSIPGVSEQTVTSLLIACGLLGGALLPKLIGWALDQYDVPTTRWIFFAFSAGMILIVLAAVALARSKKRADSPAHSAI